MKSDKASEEVKTFAWASLLNDVGAYMIFPIWPLFVTTFLGANMAILGLIDGLGDSIVSISQAVSGYLSDRLKKRKVFIWMGYAFGALSRIGYSISTVWPHLIPCRILDRGGKIRDAPRDAIVADVSKRDNRGRNFGYIKSMDKLGAVFGVLLTIFLLQYFSYKTFFFLAAIPSAIGAWMVFRCIKEKKGHNLKIYKGVSFKDIDNNFRLFLFVSALFALGSFSYSFLIIYAKDLGFEVATIPFFFLIFNVCAAAVSLPSGKIADKLGRKNVLMFSYFLWALVCLMFLFLKSYWLIALAFAVYGLHKGAFDTSQKVFVSELSPKEYRASVLGGFDMIIGLFALPASLFAGLLWESVGMAIPLYASLALAILAMVLLIFVKEKRVD